MEYGSKQKHFVELKTLCSWLGQEDLIRPSLNVPWLLLFPFAQQMPLETKQAFHQIGNTFLNHDSSFGLLKSSKMSF